MTDIVGHQYSMDSEDEEIALEVQDGVLNDLLDYLNVNVGGDYVVIVTADHGMTPYPSVTGGWSIIMTEMTDDMDNLLRSTDIGVVFLDRIKN